MSINEELYDIWKLTILILKLAYGRKKHKK